MVNLKTMKTSSGKVRKRQTSETKRRKLRGTVVKMLAVMESNPESTKDPVMEFLVTGRTGRRNAMADILGPNASVTSGDLPERLQSLTTVDADAGPSSAPSGSHHEAQDPGLKMEGRSSPSSSQEGTTKGKSEGMS